MFMCVGFIKSVGGWDDHGCYNDGKYEYEGKHYCGQHHPLRAQRILEKRAQKIQDAYKVVAKDLGVSVDDIKTLEK